MPMRVTVNFTFRRYQVQKIQIPTDKQTGSVSHLMLSHCLVRAPANF